ncbi:MAG: S8 family serine peptidase [Promethearchaeota archaeon]
MPQKRIKSFLILFIILLVQIWFNSSIYNSIHLTSEEKKLKDDKKNIEFSKVYNEDVIVFFNKSSYNISVIAGFQFYGGSIKKQWNNLFSSFSGFAGKMPSESNLTLFKNEFPTAQIENDEYLEMQMNYASIQSGAINSTWALDGYQGDTNCSVALLDTGINPNHVSFPNGYNPLDLSGDIVGWENFIDNDPISDNNGHGTFLSSLVSGTGTTLNQTVTIKIYGNYSHLDLFEEYTPSKNYSFKAFSFNATNPNSSIFINSSSNWEAGEINGFWIELFYDNSLVGYSYNENPNDFYTINHTLSMENLGIYDLYIKYHKTIQSIPNFTFNSAITFFPETYFGDRKDFTGIANASKIVAYKILNESGVGHSSNLISALGSVLQNRTKYHIISTCLSITTLGEEIETINKAINDVIESGVIVVIAAGNSGIERSEPLNKLAKNKNAIIVGAINDNDQVTSYSSMGKNFGDYIKPDIVAPGGSKIDQHRTIISAGRESSNFTSYYGTSISTAIVAAAINILIEAKWKNWNQWNLLNVSENVKYIKAILLMTASETNLEREDDPSTIEDERNFSPTLSRSPLTMGLRDIHEGYGRLNIQGAIDALTKSVFINTTTNGTLISSLDNPLGPHVFSRKIKLLADEQYLFNLSLEDSNVDFDVFLYSNQSNQYGEPILLEASRKFYGDLDYFYFTPKNDQTDCIVIVKAIEGSGDFILNISTIENKFKPSLKVPEITYIGDSKNTTILGLQEFSGNNPNKNYSIDNYRFYIDYYDNDTSGVPPQEVYVYLVETSENRSLTQFFPTDDNFTDGALFVSDYFQFPNIGIFHYFFIASDGKFITRFPEVGYFNITIEFPTDSIQFPTHHNFNDGMGNWTFNGTGWDILHQINEVDDRSRIFQSSWESLYFGTYHNYPSNYTYQPVKVTEDPYPNGSLISPLYNLTQVNNTPYVQPYAKFGIRSSINSGDFIYLQINLNWTGWQTIRTYTDQEREWFMEEVNLSDYVGNFIQFKFEAILDDTFDPINYKGFILDYFAIEYRTNFFKPIITFNLPQGLPITQESQYYQFQFSCEYFELENNYPEFVYLEIGNNNYTMYNAYGDWNATSYKQGDWGILFKKSLNIENIVNRSFRFHVSDGKFINSSQWYNEDNSLLEFVNPNYSNFNIFKDNKYIGYNFSSNDLSDFYIAGTPKQKELTAWLEGDNSWHIFERLGRKYLYCGEGQSFGGINQGYGMNWDANLITKPVYLGSDYELYLEFGYDISLQNEFFQPEDQLDECIVSISKDYGNSWTKLKEYTYETEPLSGNEKIEISQYADEVVMIMFTLNTNDFELGLGYGWLLSDIYVGYEESTDFISPEITIINPQNDTTLSSKVKIKALVSDNIEIDESRFSIFLNDKSVDSMNILYNSTTNVLEYNWDTNRYIDGTYEIKLVAYDKAGNRDEVLINVRVNNMKWWSLWGPYLIFILIALILGFGIYFYLEKKGKIKFESIREYRAEKIRLKDVDKDQIIKKIELIGLDEELNRPLTLHCKYCKSWFSSDSYDIICPVCGRDQIYATYICENCGRYYYKDEPGENFYCKNKNCHGVRLFRREKEEIREMLAEKGIFLREFEKKGKKFSILNNE